MLPAKASHPHRFSAIAFAAIGLVFGLLRTAPWSPQGLFLMNNPLSKVLWALVVALVAGFIGFRYGESFVQSARDRRFAAAAGIVAVALVASSAVAIFTYCVALIVTGDFGRSVGIFGTFQPNGVFQKLLGTTMVFVVGFLANLLGSIFIGFFGGYITALLFDDDY
jgi:hypothetical protein